MTVRFEAKDSGYPGPRNLVDGTTVSRATIRIDSLPEKTPTKGFQTDRVMNGHGIVCDVFVKPHLIQVREHLAPNMPILKPLAEFTLRNVHLKEGLKVIFPHNGVDYEGQIFPPEEVK